MKRILSFVSLFFLSLPLWAQEATQEVADTTIDEQINETVEPFANFITSVIFVSFKFNDDLSIPIVLIWLVFGALIFTFYFRFINIRGFKTAIDIVRGKYSDPDEEGEVSHFQALTTALSGTVGLGNIAGVALAISAGGPGATVWMIIAGILGMSTKFVECTLGVKYRQIDKNGTVHGGPMYYLRQGFADLKMVIGGQEKSYSTFGKVLAFIFAVACVGGSFGGGNMFQSNQATKLFAQELGKMDITYFEQNKWAFGVIMAILVAVVIIGGIKSIAKVTDKIVPFMCGLYVLAALAVLGSHFTDIPAAFGTIISSAFTLDPKAIGGGIMGALLVGVQRAAFSNEAGVGSAPIAHSAVKTEYPASEGIVALLEPFIDTVVICTMTALVIVITGEYLNFAGSSSTEVGVRLTSDAFKSVFPWFPFVLMIAVVLFAFSTMISWSYYGLQAWEYLFGKGKAAEYTYKAIFCIFVVIGSSAEMKNVVNFSDAMIFTMCFPNIFGLYFLAPVVRNELKLYVDKIGASLNVRKV